MYCTNCGAEIDERTTQAAPTAGTLNPYGAERKYEGKGTGK